jgi:putative transposase
VQAVQALKATFPLDVLLEIAEVARSTFFSHQARLTRPDRHEALDAAIHEVVTRTKGRYGHRRIHRELGKDRWRVAKKTVLKRMRVLGVSCQVRRRKRFTTWRGDLGIAAPNTLNRAFSASHPNEKWVTDVTEFRIGEDRLYLSPVMDLYDRQIIAYTTGRSPNLALTTRALREALATLGPADHPLVHSDQGFQYQHRAWQQLLATAGATPSMSRKGNCLDNAVIESFFGHLKSEVFLERFATLAALETAIHAYIRWYNHDRTSTTLNGMSPVQYRAHAFIV